MMTGKKYAKYKVKDTEKQQRVKDYLLGRGDAVEESEQHCLYRVRIVGRTDTAFVRQFNNGTLTVDGPPELFDGLDQTIQQIVGGKKEPVKKGEGSRLQAQIDAVQNVELGDWWIGTDESGKGDYFGPLVGAAVMLDQRMAAVLEEIGVQDSKRISDNQIYKLKEAILQVCEGMAQVVLISPERYNQLFAKFSAEKKNSSSMLAWAHARAVENILEETPVKDITVLVDKFTGEKTFEQQLLEKTKSAHLNFIHLPKAEANTAVAAASILARDAYLSWMHWRSKDYGIELPKGASDPRIPEIGKRIVARHGEAELARVAKLHFRTTGKILGNR